MCLRRYPRKTAETEDHTPRTEVAEFAKNVGYRTGILALPARLRDAFSPDFLAAAMPLISGFRHDDGESGSKLRFFERFGGYNRFYGFKVSELGNGSG